MTLSRGFVRVLATQVVCVRTDRSAKRNICRIVVVVRRYDLKYLRV